MRFAGQRFYQSLLKAGVRIFEFQPTFIHAKFVLADEWVSIGSCNFDHWNLHWNLEANQEAIDPQLAADVRQLFERNFAASQGGRRSGVGRAALGAASQGVGLWLDGWDHHAP
ncbi:hypothetical protein HSBAA_52720 [Vreelandella sulfidaeris]|uniref:Phospholipase D-like domain-containing protein n=1 Tax=Vreelandella sulfidaeris TaxID=115553 RepID=A0A455UCL6_9GAMM|nr:hypothetical protein HSBAA_52720 [Halomonas sulfidaeris]